MSGPNPQQQQVIDALNGDVYVSAGAGTGKTYTLTRRIVSAVCALIDAGQLDPLPIERIMAITFTKAAAAELRFRIRAALSEESRRAQGERAKVLEACALGVDDAWISTIHSMAGRILRENAIALNIDPSFETLSAQEAEALELEALQFAMKEAASSASPSISRLMASYQAVSHSTSMVGISDLVAFLRDRAKVMDGGLDALNPGLRQPSASALSHLASCGRAVLATLEGDGWSDSDRAKLIDFSGDLAHALEKSSAWLSSADAAVGSYAVGAVDTAHGSLGAAGGVGCADRADAPESPLSGELVDSYLDALYSFPPTTDKFGLRSKEHGSLMSDYRGAYRKAATSAWSMLSALKMEAVLEISRLAEQELLRLKSMGGTSLDEDDLLARCYAELSNPANGAIADRYRSQFAYIMVDEFQDTDRLQMKLIGLLGQSPSHAYGHALGFDAEMGGMCTVGDVQQSIYRFRGADVDVSMSRRKQLESGDGAIVSLSSNYRSHASILHATELVFSQPSVFGDSFLKLDAARLEGDAPWCDSLFSRVSFQFLHSDRKSKRTGSDGISSEERLVFAARSVAARFKDLISRGVPPSKMAILLGRMTNADAYSQALREVGIECVIAGGSVFSDTREADLVADLLRHAADPHDDMALLKLLVSPLFAISDDVLLSLVRPCSPDGMPLKRRSLSDAFLSPCDEGFGFEEPSSGDVRALRIAQRSLKAFRDAAHRGDASAALRNLLMDCGALHRIQVRGDASSFSSAGNFAKALRIVASLERTACGVAGVRMAYEHHLRYEKESPGVLSRSSSEFVRIMTVHSSKGLEFDHVAVADLKDGTVQRYGSAIENVGDAIYAALPVVERDLSGRLALDNHKKVMGFFEGRLDECGSRLAGLDDLGSSEASSSLRDIIVDGAAPGFDDRSEAVVEYMRVQELQEARRLLYVAMTRARESLLVVHSQSGKPSDGCYKGAYADIYSALASELGIPDDPEPNVKMQAHDISFERRMLIREELTQDELESVSAFLNAAASGGDSGNAGFEVPLYAAASALESERFSLSSALLRSYTSLSAAVPYEFSAVASGDSPDDAAGESVDPDGLDRRAFSLEEGPASEDDGDATALGTAFHRLAQMAIELASDSSPDERVASVPESALGMQAAKLGLSDSQNARLSAALELWFASDACNSFLAHKSIAAEVPFTASVDVRSEGMDGRSFTLEGEIDGLATDGDGIAFLIDYKTGSSAGMGIEALHERHALQAKCYAFALLSNGFNGVRATFVRVEDAHGPRCGSSQPTLVEYSFDSGDIDSLREDIVQAWLYSMR